MSKTDLPMKNNQFAEPWERQEGETTKPYEAFCVYRDLGTGRSIAEVCRRLNKSRQLLGRWSSQYSWVKRCEAWDSEQDRIARQEQLKEIKNMRKRHASIAERAMEKVSAALESIDLAGGNNRGSDVAKLMDAASKLERLSRGDVGEVIEERDGGQATSAVQFYIPDNGRDRKDEEEDDTNE